MKLSREPILLDHGYNESKPTGSLNIEDMHKAATFRGGARLSEKMVMGNLYMQLNWQCYKGHKFRASPFLILKAGHWCPYCEDEAWNHGEWAKFNPYFAQVWTPVHGDRNSVYIKK